MATFNGGRMVALFLCMLFALNASFAQVVLDEDEWVTVAVYMADPISERVAPAVDAYKHKWNDPLTWETFDRDFTPARKAQLNQVEADNDARIASAEAFLRKDIADRGDGTSTWYPAWIPLALAKGDKEEGVATDSLFKNIINIKGPKYSEKYKDQAKRGQPQTLEEFFDNQGLEPDGLKADGTEKWKRCTPGRDRCRDKEFAKFRDLVVLHNNPAVNVISFAIKAKITTTPPPEAEGEVTFAGEQDGGPAEKDVEGGDSTPLVYAEFDYGSIRLLQPAVHDDSPYVIDTPPYKTPAAKPNASAEASSWGRIKATFADD